MLPILLSMVCTVMFIFGVFGIPGLSPVTQLCLVLPVSLLFMLFGMCITALMVLAER